MQTTPSVTAARLEFVRFPRTGERCPITSLSRPFLYAIAKQGLIKTISLRDRGKQRGVRLIVVDSLIDYINGGDQAWPVSKKAGGAA